MVKLLGLPPRNPRRAKPPSKDEAPSRSREPAFDDDSLPGNNPYDNAVAAARITYSEAKTRDELHIVAEKTKQARIDSEAAAIDLEIKKLQMAKERESVISKEEYIKRQETLTTIFLELLRLTISECSTHIPPSEREDAVTDITDKSRLALAALAESVLKKQSQDVVVQVMHDAFMGDEV